MKDKWKDNISFVLVGPKEGGNIGASARAIKNMGFHNLELVSPQNYPSEEAEWFAHGAEDVLRGALVHSTLKEALKDKALVVGTSRRLGKKRGITLTIKDAVKRILRIAHKNKVAILFGTEIKGLSNKETAECAFLINIPTSSQAPSLNLAQAVMITAYELSSAKMPRQERLLLVTKEELDLLFGRIEKTLSLIGYYGNTKAKTMRGLMRLIGRAGLTPWELNMLHGICSQMTKSESNDKD